MWDVIVEENKAAARAARGPSQVAATPQLPVSTFSRLSKIRTVQPKKQKGREV